MSKKAKAVFQSMTCEWVVVYIERDNGGQYLCHRGGHVMMYASEQAACDAAWGLNWSGTAYATRPTNLSQDELRELVYKECEGKLLK